MRSSVATIRPPAALRVPTAVAFAATQLALVAALLWFCLPQGLGGRAGWVLVSGRSMLPRLHTGDLVLVEHESSYHAGEVVAYRVPKGQVGAGHVVIHRIRSGNGDTGWTVQGDNRTAPDLWHPTNHDVIGAERLRIPDAWIVLRFFHVPLFLALVAACAVFFWIGFGAEPQPAGGRYR